MSGSCMKIATSVARPADTMNGCFEFVPGCGHHAPLIESRGSRWFKCAVAGAVCLVSDSVASAVAQLPTGR